MRISALNPVAFNGTLIVDQGCSIAGTKAASKFDEYVRTKTSPELEVKIAAAKGKQTSTYGGMKPEDLLIRYTSPRTYQQSGFCYNKEEGDANVTQHLVQNLKTNAALDVIG